MIEYRAQTLIEEIAAEYAKLPEVTAVVLTGSSGSGFSDEGSDIDLYVYAEHGHWHGEPIWCYTGHPCAA